MVNLYIVAFHVHSDFMHLFLQVTIPITLALPVANYEAKATLPGFPKFHPTFDSADRHYDNSNFAHEVFCIEILSFRLQFFRPASLYNQSFCLAKIILERYLQTI